MLLSLLPRLASFFKVLPFPQKFNRFHISVENDRTDVERPKMVSVVIHRNVPQDLWPYSKRELELKSNLGKILPVNYKFIRIILLQSHLIKLKLEFLKFDFI